MKPVIFLVDDEADYLAEFKDLLANDSEKYDLQFFQRARDVELELGGIDTWRLPSLIFIDVNLSFRDEGFELCRRIKESFQSVRLIILTAGDYHDAPVRAARSGASAFYSKEDLIRTGFLAEIINYQLAAASKTKEMADRQTEMFLSAVVHFMDNSIRIVATKGQEIERLAESMLREARDLDGYLIGLSSQLADLKALDRAQRDRRATLLRFAQSAKRVLEPNGIRVSEHVNLLLKALSKDRNVVVSSEWDGEFILDSALFSLCVAEVLKNADAYTPAVGSIFVDVKIEASLGGRILRVEIEDEGPGVSPEERERIFEPTIRGSAAINSKVQGFGFGLTGARRAARSHSCQRALGDIVCVQPLRGRGARFIISLPELTGNQ